MNRSTQRAGADTLLATALAALAAIGLGGYLLALVRLPIDPAVLGVIAIVSGFAASRWLLEDRSDASGGAADTIALLLVVVVVCGYALWLAWPSLLPIADGPDIVHHLSLIHFIQRTHRLPSDPALLPYLGEMMSYTPGSHIIAAAAGEWMGVDALRLLHPVMALFVALKAALVYAIVRRVLPAGARAPVYAGSAVLLLLVPAEYFLGSFVKYGFYAQVIAETFAAGVLFAIVWWRDGGGRATLVLGGVCAAASFLAWPVFLPACGAAAAVAVLVRRGSWKERLTDAALVCAPVAVFVIAHLLAHASSAGLLKTGGFVTIPSVRVFSAPFIVLVIVGAGVAAWRAEGRMVLLFASCALAELGALAGLDAAVGSTMFYLPYKMVYLLMPPCAVLAALPLAQVSAFAARRWRAIAPMAMCVPLAAAAYLMRGRLPWKPLPSPITASTYEAGLWTREHLPPACVDYFSRHWLTGYWLHVDVLGNPRVSARTRGESFEFRDAVAKWIEHRGLPYAIVEDLTAVPYEAREEMQPLRQFGAAAVVRARAPAACDDATVPIDRLADRGVR